MAADVMSSRLIPEDCISFAHNNSCISLSTTSEPCVNKTIHHLESLKKCISNHTLANSGRKLKASFSDLPGKHKPITPSPPPTPKICVEGQNVFTVEKPGTEFPEDVIGVAISLVVRLEEDRTETVRALEMERNRTKELQAVLDTESARRLVLLETAVQEGGSVVCMFVGHFCI